MIDDDYDEFTELFSDVPLGKILVIYSGLLLAGCVLGQIF